MDKSDQALAELLTLTVEVDSWGSTYYRNHLGQLHRVLGPAVIYSDGVHWWFQNGQRHRTDGPAIECVADGKCGWWLYDQELTEQEWNERIKSI